MTERLEHYQIKIDNLTTKAKESKSIHPENKKVLLSFISKIETEPTTKGVPRKDGTRFKLTQDTCTLAEMLEKNTFKQIYENEEAFDAFLEKIRRKKEWNQNSIAQRSRSLICILKTTFKRLPDWMKEKMFGRVGFTPPHENKLYTLYEMLNMIQAAPSTKTRAILSVLREGLRPAEILRLNTEDISFDGEGRAVIMVRGGKTGYRNVPTRRGFVYLKAWLDAHPTKKAGDPLFISNSGKRVSAEYLSKVNRAAFEKAKVNSVRDRKLYCWRKSTITQSLRGGMSLLQASKFFGTSVAMLEATYGSVSIEELNASVDVLAGQEPERKPVVIQDLAIKCARCENENASFEKVCVACGWNLSEKNPIMNMEQQMAKMHEEMRIMQELISRKLDPTKEKIDKETMKEILT